MPPFGGLQALGGVPGTDSDLQYLKGFCIFPGLEMCQDPRGEAEDMLGESRSGSSPWTDQRIQTELQNWIQKIIVIIIQIKTNRVAVQYI